MVLILVLNAWAGALILLYLLASHQFQMPSDPTFYLLWFGLSLLTEISYTLVLAGMLNTTFFAATSLFNIEFVFTALFAAIFLGERENPIKIAAIIITACGALLFFKKGISKKIFSENKGFFLIILSLFFTPVEYVLYKAASLHVSSYHQFLTGRLTMDFTFYTLFFILITAFWYRRNPIPHIRSYMFSRTGVAYIGGHTVTELLESWLIYKIPISLFTILGTLSIPTAYFVGKAKYEESFNWRHILGSTLRLTWCWRFTIRLNRASQRVDLMSISKRPRSEQLSLLCGQPLRSFRVAAVFLFFYVYQNC